jgi:hypothetical protein
MSERSFAALVLGADPVPDEVRRGLAEAGAEVVLRAGEAGEAGPEGSASAVLVDPAGAASGVGGVDLAGAVRQVLAALPVDAGRTGCVVLTRPVVDTLKVIDTRGDGDGVVLGTADRDHHRTVTGPLAGPFGVLAPLAHLADLPQVVSALLAAGVSVRAVDY